MIPQPGVTQGRSSSAGIVPPALMREAAELHPDRTTGAVPCETPLAPSEEAGAVQTRGSSARSSIARWLDGCATNPGVSTGAQAGRTSRRGGGEASRLAKRLEPELQEITGRPLSRKLADVLVSHSVAVHPPAETRRWYKIENTAVDGLQQFRQSVEPAQAELRSAVKPVLAKEAVAILALRAMRTGKIVDPSALAHSARASFFLDDDSDWQWLTAESAPREVEKALNKTLQARVPDEPKKLRVALQLIARNWAGRAPMFSASTRFRQELCSVAWREFIHQSVRKRPRPVRHAAGKLQRAHSDAARGVLGAGKPERPRFPQSRKRDHR